MTITIVELLKGLPENPIDALGTILERGAEKNERSDVSATDFKTVVVVIEAAIKRFDLSYGLPSKLENEGWATKYNYYKSLIRNLMHDHETELLENTANAELDRIIAERDGEPGFAILTSDEKSAIMQRIETIRKLIDTSGLLVRKKNTLFNKLTDLANEVMRDGTRTDALFTFLGELALTAGIMTKNAKPAIDEAKEITRIIVGSRATREGISLPSPEKILRLPPMED